MTLRLALLFREVKNCIGTRLPVVIGDPIPYAALAQITDRQALVDHLRGVTYALAGRGDGCDAVSAAAAIGATPCRGSRFLAAPLRSARRRRSECRHGDTNSPRSVTILV